VKNFTKHSKKLIAIGIVLIITSFYVASWEKWGLFGTDLQRDNLFENLILENGEVYTHEIKTTQGYWHVLIVEPKEQCPRLDILDDQGNLIKHDKSQIQCRFNLSQLERDSAFQLQLTNDRDRQIVIDGKYEWENSISWFSDYLPRHGINLFWIGIGLTVLGGILLIFRVKEKLEMK
jgi:hypothetical protein